MFCRLRSFAPLAEYQSSSGGVPQEACSAYQCEREKGEQNIGDPDIIVKSLKPIALLTLSFGCEVIKRMLNTPPQPRRAKQEPIINNERPPKRATF